MIPLSSLSWLRERCGGRRRPSDKCRKDRGVSGSSLLRPLRALRATVGGGCMLRRWGERRRPSDGLRADGLLRVSSSSSSGIGGRRTRRICWVGRMPSDGCRDDRRLRGSSSSSSSSSGIFGRLRLAGRIRLDGGGKGWLCSGCWMASVCPLALESRGTNCVRRICSFSIDNSNRSIFLFRLWFSLINNLLSSICWWTLTSSSFIFFVTVSWYLLVSKSSALEPSSKSLNLIPKISLLIFDGHKSPNENSPRIKYIVYCNAYWKCSQSPPLRDPSTSRAFALLLDRFKRRLPLRLPPKEPLLVCFALWLKLTSWINVSRYSQKTCWAFSSSLDLSQAMLTTAMTTLSKMILVMIPKRASNKSSVFSGASRNIWNVDRNDTQIVVNTKPLSESLPRVTRNRSFSIESVPNRST